MQIYGINMSGLRILKQMTPGYRLVDAIFRGSTYWRSGPRKFMHGHHPLRSLCLTSQITQAVASMASTNKPLHETCRDEAIAIFTAAVDSVKTDHMVSSVLQYCEEDHSLVVAGSEYNLKRNVYVVGFGKAVSGMACAVERILGDHIVKGIISVPCGTQESLMEAGRPELILGPHSRIRQHEGALNNLPDEAAHQAAQAIHRLVLGLKAEDLLIVLISGGGSSLLPLPWPPITILEELEMTKLLANKGANIIELNTMRKHVEILKGGGLARAAKPAKVISLILSDVIDDRLDIIASGPTASDLLSPFQCLEILQKYGVRDQAPKTIIRHLESKAAQFGNTTSLVTEAHGPSLHVTVDNVKNVIVGSNQLSTITAMSKGDDLGYVSSVVTNSLQGEARHMGTLFARLAKFVCLEYSQKSGRQQLVQLEIDLVSHGVSKSTINEIRNRIAKAANFSKGVCLITGGETVVHVTGNGKGGRNQEMALAAAIELRQLSLQESLLNKFTIEFLSCGTDGQDGPTDAAGAIVDPGFSLLAEASGCDPIQYLENNDSYSLFKQVGKGRHLITTGLTGTNVMDIQVLLVKPTSLM